MTEISDLDSTCLEKEDNERINVRFVIPSRYSNQNQCSDDMKLAFQSCEEHELSPEWTTEAECYTLSPSKQDVFVLQEFDTDVFNHLKNFKCMLVGPRCVLTCLVTGVPIPYNCSPIFTTAMRDTVVTTTNIYGKEKEELIKKMGYMGAVCSAKLTESNTHLVARNVLSLKYEKAVERNIPVMTEKWIEALWEASCQRNVHANDPEFLVYKCPVFHGLTVTCSNFGVSEKEELRNLITVNGGVYSGKLQQDVTKMLIINYPVGTKYTYAREWHMPCVTAAWVHESVKKGYALAIEPYKTPERGAKCSTPVHEQSKIGPSDFSMVSSIAPDEIPQTTHINETVADVTLQSIINKAPAPSNYRPTKGKGSSYAEVLQKLDVKDAKKAGPFLDGCNVYLSGFADDELEKLRAILNYGGATRFNEITEAVTHVIVGENVTADMKIIKSKQLGACVVNINWLVESLKQKCPANEEQFSCCDIPKQSTEPASPLSKKGIQMLRRGSERPVPFPPLPEAKSTANETDQHGTTDIVNQYLQSAHRRVSAFEEQDNNMFKRPNEVTIGGPATSRQSQVQEDVSKQKTADCDSSVSQSSETKEESAVAVFASLTFLVLGLEEEQKAQVSEVLESRGGKVASNTFKGIADYAVLDVTPPAEVMANEAASEIVNFLWVEDCIWSSELVPVQYYHRPLVFDYTKKPLEKCVVCISSYTGVERKFISMVAAQLGAICQDMFARKNFPKKNTLASTHLICCDPGSAKYSAAIKWNIPAVSHKWVMACAREGRRVDEKRYVTGAESDSSEEQNESVSTSESADSVKNQNTPTVLNVNNDADCNSEIKAMHKRIEQLRQEGNMGPPVSPSGDTEPQKSPLTPFNRNSGGFSQETPILIPKLQDDSLLGRWPFAPNAETPKGPSYVQTPETPYGQVFKDNPSPDMRKRWKKWIDNFPEFEKSPPVRKRKLSTPLSELKRRCWEKILPKKTTTAGENEVNETEALAEKQRCEVSSSEDLPAAASRLPSLADFHTASTSGSSASSVTKPLALGNTAKRLFSSPDVTPSSSPSAVHRSLEKLNQVLTTPNTESPTVRIRRTRNDIVGEDDDFQRHKVPAKDSQFEVVGWEDPSERNYSRGPHIFMLSSIEPEEREHYEQIIINLGGKVADKQTFDISITHLACGRPTRSEKLLASIASGKWVLHKSYLDHCAEEGRFILEEEFEWGNPSAISIGRQLKSGTLEFTLAQAAYRWRCRLSRSDRGAFTGMIAVVCISRERQEAFKRLICAGGGKIVEPQFLDQATHFFLEFNKVKPSVSIEELVKRRIPCVPPMYLNDYLIKDPPPQAHDMVIPEYKAILERLAKEESNN